MLLLCIPGGLGAASEDNTVAVLFSGSKSAAAWATVISLEDPDTTLLCEDNMIKLEWDGTVAPSLILSSWSGGAEWRSISPCANIDGALFYSYEDMISGFGDDLTLVDSINVMNRGAAAVLNGLSVVTAASVRSAQNADKPVRRVIGYLPDWSYSAYKTMDLSDLTHINIAFCNPDTSGKLSCMIPDDELKALVAAAHEKGVKVLASLGGAGGSDNYPALVKTTETMTAFNGKIMDFCETYGLDGIDLDIEGDVDTAFWDTYEQWCLSLRSCCDERGMLLTTATAYWIAVHISNTAMKCFDIVNIMAYDNDTDPASHSTYDYAVESLKTFNIERGVPKSKLVLGVPFYGRGYNADGTLSWASYESFSSLVSENAENYNRDSYNGIAYNGAETMRRKCELAKAYGGIMIWEISQDAAGEYSLLSLIGSEILGSTELNPKKYLLGAESIGAEQLEQLDTDSDEQLCAVDLCIYLRKKVA